MQITSGPAALYYRWLGRGGGRIRIVGTSACDQHGGAENSVAEAMATRLRAKPGDAVFMTTNTKGQGFEAYPDGMRVGGNP
ncbi:30S ribosomal protein S9 [Comamonas thiooxydans]|nr:30S ribosomal protein S9 [Comamonas thiooxydans]